MPIETPRNASPRSVRLLVAWLLLAIALAGAGWIGAERRPARETRIELRHRVDLERADAGERSPRCPASAPCSRSGSSPTASGGGRSVTSRS
jgi:hypothetical protein